MHAGGARVAAVGAVGASSSSSAPRPEVGTAPGCLASKGGALLPCAPRKLRLSDGEIMLIFQGAQREAEKEADWRCIQATGVGVGCARASSCGPTEAVDGAALAASAAAAPGPDQSTDGKRSARGDREKADVIRLMTHTLAHHEAPDVAPQHRVADACCSPILTGSGAALSPRLAVLTRSDRGAVSLSTTPCRADTGACSGLWRTNEGEVVQISGRSVAWSSGAFSNIVFANGMLSMIIEGRMYHAQLEGDASQLLWDDGTEWRRIGAIQGAGRFLSRMVSPEPVCDR